MKRYLPALTAGLFIISSAASAMSLKVQEVGYNIEARGAKSVVAELSKAGQLPAVINNIKLGDDDWIALAPKLVNAENAAFSLQVKNALTAALIYNPVAVLKAAKKSPSLTIADICQVPANDTQNLKQRVLNTLSTIRNDDMLPARDACINALKR